MTKIRVHVYVSGRVQGVYFRQGTKNHAQGQDITGWVRNLDDGRVEAVFEGEQSAVQVLIKYCTQGPKDALVKNVDTIWELYQGEFQSFDIIY
ncbi:MAG: acylphosphatase [Nitrososphaerota archaeon]|jgi:acylphosphatase|nr:acylphosphatase [Nitrososphaerota archaeon]